MSTFSQLDQGSEAKTMNLLFALIVTLVVVNHRVENTLAQQSEAAQECDRVHHILIENIPNANASFVNSKCRLNCAIGSALLAFDSIYEGQACPLDSTGICKSGKCVGGLEDALEQCTLYHRLDFHTTKDHSGSGFTQEGCALRCVLDGLERSHNARNEGSPCPGNSGRVCQSGFCVESQTPPTVTPTPPPTPVPFTKDKLHSINITNVSTSPELQSGQFIATDHCYDVTCMHYEWKKIGELYPNHNVRNYFNSTDFLLHFNHESHIAIFLNDNFTLGQHKENLFDILARLYVHNYEVNNGLKESVNVHLPLMSTPDPTRKLFDVTYRFEIVFNQ